MHPRHVFPLIPLVAVLGCAVEPSSSNQAAQPDLSGNWLIATGTTVKGTYPGHIYSFTGALQVSNGSVTGTVRAADLADLTPCISPNLDLPVMGAVNAAGNLSLSVPIGGAIATVAAVIGNPEALNNGTLQIADGACAMSATTVVITRFAPATGTYSGSFNLLDPATLFPVPGMTANVTAILTQSASPNADGQFPINGTVTSSGGCSGTFLLAGQVVSGGTLLAPPGTIASSTPALVGGTDPTGTYLVAGFGPWATCGSQTYGGTLTRQ